MSSVAAERPLEHERLIPTEELRRLLRWWVGAPKKHGNPVWCIHLTVGPCDECGTTEPPDCGRAVDRAVPAGTRASATPD